MFASVCLSVCAKGTARKTDAATIQAHQIIMRIRDESEREGDDDDKSRSQNKQSIYAEYQLLGFTRHPMTVRDPIGRL